MDDASEAHELPGRQDSVVDAALAYREKDWQPIPLQTQSKAAIDEAWQEPHIGADEIPRRFETAGGVGLLLGEPSGGLTDLDLDTPEAVQAARLVMTPTPMVSGRKSRPNSHRWVVVDDRLSENRIEFVDPLDGTLLLEIRSNRHQTMVPPSVHPSGEPVVWYGPLEPTRISAADLTREAGWAAFVAFLARHWGEWETQHHELALHLSGGMLRGGYDPATIERLVAAVCTAANDHEPQDRLNAVASTVQTFENDGRVTGWPKVAEVVGQDAATRLREWLGIESRYADDRPAVQVTSGNLDKMTNDAWEGVKLANDPPTLFRRSNQPFRVERIDDTDLVVLVQLNRDLLRHHLAEMLRWYALSPDRQTGALVYSPSKPPVEVVLNMLAEENVPLPVLNRVVTVPVFAPNGVLQTEPGYHPEAKVYYMPPAGLVLPAVPARPTGADVERARSWLLDELLHDFPFVDAADRAHALALAILPFVRDMVTGPTPLHLFEASKQGTGKGLLVSMLTSIFTGGEGASETPLSGSEEEVRKNLFSMLLEGRAFILLDNLTGTVSSTALSVALTSTTYSDRKLGVSETPYVSVRCAWVGTANNAALDSDLTRRTIRSRMVANVENPWDRPAEAFRHPKLAEWAKENRGQLVWSVLTLVQAWVAEGQPDGKKTLGTYESWARVIGGVLDTAGVPGFLTNLHEFYADVNAESAGWQQFVAAWWTRFGPEPQSATALHFTATEAGFTFKEWRDEKQRAELGTMLKAQKDNIYAGFAIRQGKDRSTKANNYRLEPREGQTWERPAPRQNGTTDQGGVFDPSAFAIVPGGPKPSEAA